MSVHLLDNSALYSFQFWNSLLVCPGGMFPNSDVTNFGAGTGSNIQLEQRCVPCAAGSVSRIGLNINGNPGCDACSTNNAGGNIANADQSQCITRAACSVNVGTPSTSGELFSNLGLESLT